MIPSSFVVMGELPMTPSGKLDRHALPAPDQSASELIPTFVPPSNELEETIAAVWRSLLELTQVGVHDNFFDLGGDSLLINRVRGRLEAMLGKELSIVDLFRYPTVRTLAEFLSRGKPDERADAFVSVQQRAKKQIEALAGMRRRAI
jgi:acyl carrier protein